MGSYLSLPGHGHGSVTRGRLPAPPRRPRQILSFSYGAHHCLGAAAARLQARVTLEELFGRCPRFSVDAAAAEFASGHYVRRHQSLPFTPEAVG